MPLAATSPGAETMREFASRPGRAEIELRVDVRIADTFFATTSKNIGTGGLFLATDRALNVGDRVELELTLPHHIQAMSVAAEVRWTRQEDGGQGSGAGLRFVNLPLGATIGIHELVRGAKRR
jgi:uncharacterized protein (TIGR02266 family)